MIGSYRALVAAEREELEQLRAQAQQSLRIIAELVLLMGGEVRIPDVVRAVPPTVRSHVEGDVLVIRVTEPS